MTKDSKPGKRKYRKRKQQIEEETRIEEKTQTELDDESEYDDPDIESEVEEEESLTEKWGKEYSDDDQYELSESELAQEQEEAEAEAKKRQQEERRRIRKENKTINYVDPAAMLKRIEDYYKTDVMSEDLAMDIRRICDRLSMSSRFVNYTYREEMAGDAFLSAYKAIYYKKFKIGCGYNPFSYITQVAFHSMVQRIKTEHKEREKTDMFREAHFDEYLKETADEANAANESFDDD